MRAKTAVIVGAGPAGLTAALELLRQTDIRPIVIEVGNDVGGLSKTVVHNGNRMDIGGHRFFSKSDWVMQWWQQILPLDQDAGDSAAAGRKGAEKRMLVRSRLSRIYFLRRFFDYPIKLNLRTMRNLGAVRLVRIALSYCYVCLFPRLPERNLEDFIINRFGRELYLTFFKDYTEKVWGVACDQISPEWGAQRIKGLSVGKALLHAMRNIRSSGDTGLQQKGGQTSLIERFLYPKLGPGQMWQEVAAKVVAAGGEIRFHHRVTGVALDQGRVLAVSGTSENGDRPFSLACDYLFSTMPVRELIDGMVPAPPEEVRRVARGLEYRDFLTIGLLVRKMKPQRQGAAATDGRLPDNWIYIQDKDVRLGRLQIFNNWSPHLVKDPDTTWLGLEYFCREGDDLWQMPDQALIRFGAAELAKIGLIDGDDVVDGRVVRMAKAYPAYFGTYGEFEQVRRYVDGITNLYLIGRNGMHRYNNQDHSMLTARLAVENVARGEHSKANIWAVNIDDEYHEERS